VLQVEKDVENQIPDNLRIFMRLTLMPTLHTKLVGLAIHGDFITTAPEGMDELVSQDPNLLNTVADTLWDSLFEAEGFNHRVENWAVELVDQYLERTAQKQEAHLIHARESREAEARGISGPPVTINTAEPLTAFGVRNAARIRENWIRRRS
jgi:hypothetical protein